MLKHKRKAFEIFIEGSFAFGVAFVSILFAMILEVLEVGIMTCMHI